MQGDYQGFGALTWATLTAFALIDFDQQQLVQSQACIVQVQDMSPTLPRLLTNAHPPCHSRAYLVLPLLFCKG